MSQDPNLDYLQVRNETQEDIDLRIQGETSSFNMHDKINALIKEEQENGINCDDEIKQLLTQALTKQVNNSK